MRLSPSFDNSDVDYSPRPSIPLESITLGKNSTPFPALPVKLVPKGIDPLSPIQKPIEISAFFDKSAQPKASLPTLSNSQKKVNLPPIVIKVEPPKANLPPQKLPEVKVVTPVIPSTTKTIAEITPIIKLTPKPIQPPPPPPIPLVEVEKKEVIVKKIVEPLAKPVIKINKPEPIKFIPPPRKSPPVEITPIVSQTHDSQNTAQIQNQIHHQLDDIQLSIAAELKKITPPAPAPTLPKPLSPAISLPSFIQSAPPNPQPQTNPAVKISTEISQTELSEPTANFSAIHFWDYFLPISNSKLNPYKSPSRSRVILGVKMGGLILLSLGFIVIGQAFIKGFSLNVIFEAISTFTLSGILLFLGQNLNLFFAPVNPYKIHEVV